MDERTSTQDSSADNGLSSRFVTVAWIIASLSLVAMLTGIWLQVRNTSNGGKLAAAVALGDRPDAPEIPIKGVPDDGAPGFDSSVVGDGSTIVVVNFWASWCGPCEDEADDLQEFAKDTDDVVVVGLNAGHEDLERDVRDFVVRHELTFPVVRGNRDDFEAWGVSDYPQTYIMGSDGQLSAHVQGPIDLEVLRAVVDAERDRAADEGKKPGNRA